MMQALLILMLTINLKQQQHIKYEVYHLLLFKNGKQLWRQSGIVPLKELERLINENI